MKVAQRAKHRYLLARLSRNPFRQPFKPFRHTRATRRALLIMVQRMVDQSLRYSLQAYKSEADAFKLVINGWPDVVQVRVDVRSLSVMVALESVGCDFLLWPDFWPVRKHGLWRCFDGGCLDHRIYTHLEDLLFDHLAVPFLDMLAAVPEGAQLRLCNLDGSHHASIESSMSVKRVNHLECREVRWPLPAGANLA